MATLPRPELFPTTEPMLDPAENRIDELIRLQKSAQRITSTLNIDEIIDRVVDEVSSSLGCVEINLYLHETKGDELVLKGVRGCTLHHKGHRFNIGRKTAARPGISGHAAMTRKMHYAPDVSLDPYYVVCEPTVRSEVGIPLEVDGELVGVFTASHHELDAFCSTQLRLFEGLCSHVAVAVQNARRFHTESKLRKQLTRDAEEARTIQQALFPRTSPLIPGFSVSGLSIPVGAVGGDWYDYIPLPDGRWGLVLADVSGKGTAAALLMSTTRGMLRSLAPISNGPGEVLTRLNNMLLQDIPSGRFVTMVYGELDPRTRTLRLANAGHLLPLIIDSNGARWIQTDRGLPLGVAASEFSEVEVKLGADARVVFYSDGITEAERKVDARWLDGRDSEGRFSEGRSSEERSAEPAPEEYGADRLLTQLLVPNATPEDLIADVKKFANGKGLRDDATVILVSSRASLLADN